MNVSEMTRKGFEELPLREWNEEVIFDSLIILPGKARDLHDSGYRCMDFVAVLNKKPICRLSSCSDVIHIDGIGGVRRRLPFTGWSIDCLPKSGLLRLFTQAKISCGPSLSSFEVFIVSVD